MLSKTAVLALIMSNVAQSETIQVAIHLAVDMYSNISARKVTYHIGHDTVVSHAGGHWVTRFQNKLFSLMERNSTHVTDFFRVPSESVVEIGRQIAI
ncbi:KUP/HAK/KT family potassium transporter [Pseudaminobacter soli (ex Li et al. 2025)]|uniref:K+ potassium transporter C-terminal domain-containing protein n=1 Tax=Pseudaminobacter soli (ex Li et al. 2025) TaxID=1295366 RepID=A0A2P7RNC3_9HYPH|nr:hypothetical protein [Mesorhizobium soli]PSJ51718.1 hypothetical protein C7I85_29310 [Mesorhizobium soli]